MVAHGIIESEFPYSSIQWDVCIFQLICMWHSYDHCLTENNGYLPLTSCGQPESNAAYWFLFKIWKIAGLFFLYPMVGKTCWIILRARIMIFSLYWGLWKINYRIITLKGFCVACKACESYLRRHCRPLRQMLSFQSKSLERMQQFHSIFTERPNIIKYISSSDKG